MRYSLLLIFSLLPLFSYAQTSNVAEGYDWLAKQCNDLDCIQGNMDMIDGQIATLVTKRLAFVKRGAQLKNTNVLAPKTAGYGNNSQRVGEQAKLLGSSPGAMGGIFNALQKQSDEYEKKYLTPVVKPNP